MPRHAESQPGWARTLAVWAFPWLFSTTAHMSLVLLLAVSFGWRSATTQGVTSGVRLDAVLLSLGQSDSGGSAPFELQSDADGDRYYDDEPAEPSEQLAAANTSDATSGGAAALSELLNEEPAVNVSGVLPASGAELGVGGEDLAGVGSAQGLTNVSRPTNRLQGGMARTSVFGASGEGHKFVYVFDRSGSMDGHGGAPLLAAKRELLGSLGNLGQTHQFQIIFYNERPRIFTPSGTSGRLVFADDQTKYLAQKFVGSITADGATRHQEALEMALRLGADVIFFLTDADEPQMTARQLAHIAQVNRGTTINAIEFGFGAQANPDNFLVRLARQNGGKHVYVDVSRLPAARR